MNTSPQRMLKVHSKEGATGRKPKLLERLENGYDIRTVQELLGHKDVKTTMVSPMSSTVDRPGFAAPFMRSEMIMEGVMPIRIRYRDKNIASTQLLDSSPFRTQAMLHSQASYTAIAAVFGVLCGSI